ncbi:MAG: hypothetical protein IJ877_06860 [Candidatus Gastranaerophilales bacterium]|nr:hypothetical protein [Candidatus Gastranaerophilales bacterium]
MHSKIFVYDRSYSIVENNPQTEQNTYIPQKEQKQTVTQKIANEIKKEIKKENKIVQNNQTKKEAPVKKETKKTIVQEPKKQITSSEKKDNKKVEPVKKVEQKVINSKKTVEKTAEAPKSITVQEREEEIAWNIWRSNLQNQIMHDTKLPYVPKGTVFKFSFEVDKYGRISSVKTWSLNSNYTPYAIQYIAPVIRSYQGREILDFPKGTQRLTTKFEGGWKIADTAIYSTPNDYNDVERIKK